MNLGPKRFINIKQHPYELFGLFALLFFFLSFILSKASLDLNLHDVYIVIPSNRCGISAIYFLFMWMLYALTTKILWTRWLTWMHVIITITVVIVLLSLSYLPVSPLDGVSRRYYAFSEFQKKDELIWVEFIPRGALIFLIAQAVFLLNVTGGLVKKAIQSKITFIF